MVVAGVAMTVFVSYCNDDAGVGGGRGRWRWAKVGCEVSPSKTHESKMRGACRKGRPVAESDGITTNRNCLGSCSGA